MYIKYLKSLLLHKWYVLVAGLKLGVPVLRLLMHDLTKFYPVEFFTYAKFHFGSGEKDKHAWSKSWLHHKNHNKHHPEYWLMSWRGDANYYNSVGERVTDYVTVLPMPETYILEMLVDFLASSKAYTGSWNISVWLNTEGIKMILHPQTEIIMSDILYDNGYFCTDNCPWSWYEGSRSKFYENKDDFSVTQ